MVPETILSTLSLRLYLYLCVHAKSLQSYLILCDSMDCSLPSSSVHGILQARILERVSISSPGDLPYTGIEPASLHLLNWQVNSLTY